MVELLPPWPQFGVFLGAAFVLGVTPGPGIFYILATSVAQGARSGLVAVLGIAAGTFVHVLLAVFGLTLLLASSLVVFQLVKYAGAVYLVALGIYLLIRRDAGRETVPERPPGDMWRAFWQAVMVNVLNPKVGIFFLAFFPQFVDPARGEPAAQFLVLGVLLIGMVLVTDTLFALAAGTVTQYLKGRGSHNRWPSVVGGLTYIGLGIFSATIDPPARG
ncbi:MAG TPA: LysE family translocator [Gammaproteobacteria bacterium]|nr:threonine transporter [Acidiferrobacteraceae bacterium]MDP6398321.1 LysE family translocator [Arenicellales bacterium]HCX88901.1 LysE family translocator [Gammaproteobacteria bacterium]MDP6552741.1 LysE family translocator [Arenicellales bacterium]MDP6791927.1 LysE family translocator [Arenicellales bacterium]